MDHSRTPSPYTPYRRAPHKDAPQNRNKEANTRKRSKFFDAYNRRKQYGISVADVYEEQGVKPRTRSF